MDEPVPGGAAYDPVLTALALALPPEAPRPAVRTQLIDLSEAPALPLDAGAYSWDEPFPGVKIALVKQDAARGVRATLLWGTPGASYPAHRHGGEEAVLVLQGAYCDERGSYGAGNVACNPAGSVHSVRILPEGDCISYIVLYGETEIL